MNTIVDKTELEECIKLYSENPRNFRNRYISNYKNADQQKFKEMVDRVCGPYYDQYGRKFGKILTLISTQFHIPKCQFCKKNDVEITGFNSYRRYCSSYCAGKDPNKVSAEMIKVATEKRNSSMKALRESPIDNAAYKEKLRAGMKKFYSSPAGEIMKKRQSELVKQKIMNGEFTPERTRSWNSWNASVDGIKFRSRFEAIFYAYCIDSNLPVEYESLRIPYVTPEGTHRIYITDFIDRKNKKLFEIKPSSYVDENSPKTKAAEKWCEENGFEFEFITEHDLKDLAKSITGSRDKVLKYLEAYKWA